MSGPSFEKPKIMVHGREGNFPGSVGRVIQNLSHGSEASSYRKPVRFRVLPSTQDPVFQITITRMISAHESVDVVWNCHMNSIDTTQEGLGIKRTHGRDDNAEPSPGWLNRPDLLRLHEENSMWRTEPTIGNPSKIRWEGDSEIQLQNIRQQQKHHPLDAMTLDETIACLARAKRDLTKEE
jgi:hypothetical protein